MHIYFSGIGGVGLGPLAEIARGAGHDVSGSDTTASPTFVKLLSEGYTISLDQSGKHMADTHAQHPIDWFVYTAALPKDHPELVFAYAHAIKSTKRDELLKKILEESNQELIAVAGTHGKTTTTAMVVWLFKQLGLPVSYLVGAPMVWAPSGAFNMSSHYFVYECDEFDRNFLKFKPDYSLITSIDYDHPDTYPTKTEYNQAFRQFLDQSEWKIMWQKDQKKLNYTNSVHMDSLTDTIPLLSQVTLLGEVNRRNACLAIQLLWNCTGEKIETLIRYANTFPGTHRRFEKLADNLYSDYAHHPDEIAATLDLASELSKNIVVVYQPHQNIRQHYMDYSGCFDKAHKVYWLPTYLSREDAESSVLTPDQLIQQSDHKKIVTAQLDEQLWQNIEDEREKGALVVLMNAGSLDDWTRQQLRNIHFA